MAKNNISLNPAQPFDEDARLQSLDFDQSHDEEQRDVAEGTGGQPARPSRMPQRAPNQEDAPGAEVMADALDDDHNFDDDGQPTHRHLDAIESSDTSAAAASVEAERDGSELDEAEQADDEPVGRQQAKALRERIARHARDPNAFEPAEAAVQRAIDEDRQKTRSGTTS